MYCNWISMFKVHSQLPLDLKYLSNINQALADEREGEKSERDTIDRFHF